MLQVKSVLEALRLPTLPISILPVFLTICILEEFTSQPINSLCAILLATIIHLIANLNAVHRNFHRVFKPKANANDQSKVIINLISKRQVSRYSYLFLALGLFIIILRCSLTDIKPLRVTISMIIVLFGTFLYCRSDKMLPIVALQEILYAGAVGPLSMCSTSYFLTSRISFQVMIYAFAVFFYTLAYTIVQSAIDAPYARQMQRSSTSLAILLDFQRSYQAYLVNISFAYGLVFLTVLGFGHWGNIFVLASITQVKVLSETFRKEQLQHLIQETAKLGVLLLVGLICSISISNFISQYVFA